MSVEFDSLRLQQSPLQTRVRLRHPHFASRTDHSMPWNPSPARTRRHRIAHGSRSSRQPQRPRQLAVRGHAAPRNFLHQLVNRIPGHFLSSSPERPNCHAAGKGSNATGGWFISGKKAGLRGHPFLHLISKDIFARIPAARSASSSAITDWVQPSSHRRIVPLTA